MTEAAAPTPGEAITDRTIRDLADLGQLGRQLTELAATDARGLSRKGYAELLVDLAGLHDQCTRITGSIADTTDTIAAPCVVGEKSVTALLRAKSKVDRQQSRRFLTAGRCRYRFPTFDAAHRSAAVTVGHVEVIAGMAKRVDSAQLAAAEPYLCAVAVGSTVKEFATACAEWEVLADPTEHFDEYLRAQARRHLYVGNDLFGGLHFGGTADPLQGETFMAAVDQKADELLRADQAEAAASGHPVTRTNAQRRVDALIELLGLGHGAGAGGRKPEPVLHLLCSCGQTTNCDPRKDSEPEPNGSGGEGSGSGGEGSGSGGEGSGGEANADPHRMPSATNIYPQTISGRLIPHRIVSDLMNAVGKVEIVKIRPDGTFIDHSTAGRAFTPKQKLLIDLHDRTCRHPGCPTPARYCDHDHIVPHSRGGPTNIANGQLLCRFHHQWKHRNDAKPHLSRAP